MKKINRIEWVIKEFDELNIYELYEILKLRSEILIMEQQCIYQDIDSKDKNSYHIFSMEGNKICSYLRVIKPSITYDEVSLGKILTNKEYRNKSLCKTNIILALDFIKIVLRQQKVKISVPESLIDFYSNLGFKKISDSYLEDTVPHIQMLINLSKWKPR